MTLSPVLSNMFWRGWPFWNVCETTWWATEHTMRFQTASVKVVFGILALLRPDLALLFWILNLSLANTCATMPMQSNPKPCGFAR